MVILINALTVSATFRWQRILLNHGLHSYLTLFVSVSARHQPKLKTQRAHLYVYIVY